MLGAVEKPSRKPLDVESFTMFELTRKNTYEITKNTGELYDNKEVKTLDVDCMANGAYNIPSKRF